MKTRRVPSRYSRTASIRMFDAIGSVVWRNLEYSIHRRARSTPCVRIHTPIPPWARVTRVQMYLPSSYSTSTCMCLCVSRLCFHRTCRRLKMTLVIYRGISLSSHMHMYVPITVRIVTDFFPSRSILAFRPDRAHRASFE